MRFIRISMDKSKGVKIMRVQMIWIYFKLFALVL